jgi:ABC-type methionine transport system ATPase subunit
VAGARWPVRNGGVGVEVLAWGLGGIMGRSAGSTSGLVDSINSLCRPAVGPISAHDTTTTPHQPAPLIFCNFTKTNT